jgi:hypothetical protein
LYYANQGTQDRPAFQTNQSKVAGNTGVGIHEQKAQDANSPEFNSNSRDSSQGNSNS